MVDISNLKNNMEKLNTVVEESKKPKEIQKSEKSSLPAYDVINVSDSNREDAITKLIELVNEKMKQGYVPVGGFLIERTPVELAVRRYFAYQAVMLAERSKES